MMLDSLVEHVEDGLDRPFAVTGRRCYLVGAMNGAFPDLGHHLPGEMGGLWTPPIKLADGFWFGLTGSTPAGAPPAEPVWLYGANCRRFTMTPGRAEREFALAVAGADVRATQEIFAPDALPGILIGLTLESAAGQDLDLTLSWLVRFDIQGGWWSNWPDRPDTATFDPALGGVVAQDSLHTEWAAAMGADRTPTGHAVGPDLWAAERTSSLNGARDAARGILRNPEELQGQGISARLDYTVHLPAGGRTTIWFALGGGMEGSAGAAQAVTDLLARRDTLRAEKLARQAALLAAAPVVASPRPDLDRVFAWSTVAMDMLTLDMPGIGPVIMAGLPGFAWFFGCDTYYTLGGLLVSGQAATALDNLRLLARYARAQGGRVPHEIVPSGDLFNPGNTVETSEYVTAVEWAYRWTGDRAFLDAVYPLCRTGIFDYLLGACDPNGDLLPDGPGILELRTAEHGKKLDVACSLYQALQSLAYLADVVGDSDTAARCAALVGQVGERISRYFWVPARQEYVWRIEPDLSVDPDEPAHSYAVLEMGVLGAAQAERIAHLFATVEGPAHTGPAGVIHPGTADFVMPIQNAVVALAEFRYGRPDKGLWYLERMADLCGYYMPGAIPEFVGPEACFLQAWSSAAYNWLLVQGFFRLNPDPARGVVTVQPQLPDGWDFLEVDNLTIWGVPWRLRLQRTASGTDFTAETGAPGTPLTFEVAGDAPVPVRFV
jgi:hypothetical protein